MSKILFVRNERSKNAPWRRTSDAFTALSHATLPTPPPRITEEEAELILNPSEATSPFHCSLAIVRAAIASDVDAIVIPADISDRTVHWIFQRMLSNNVFFTIIRHVPEQPERWWLPRGPRLAEAYKPLAVNGQALA